MAQNRPPKQFQDSESRLGFYRQVLTHRIETLADTVLKVPRIEGLRERHPEKPFHTTPEIFIQERGRLRFRFPREEFWLEPGEMAIIPRGMPHGELWEGSDFANVIVMFRPDGLFWTCGYLLKTQRIMPPDFYPSPPYSQTYCDEIATALHEGTLSRGPIVRGLLLALLGRALKALEQPSPPGHPHPLIRQCQNLIQAHFAQPDFSVQWLARALGCSPDHLSRTFRRHSGQRLMLAIHQRRIAHAKQLLADPSFHISEIAWACGFTSPSYFNRVFRALTGATPGEVRTFHTPLEAL